MKRIILALSMVLALAVGYAPPVHANGIVFGQNDICSKVAAKTAPCGAAPINPFNIILENAIRVAARIGGVLSVIFIIVGGLYIIFANGDSGKVETGRNTIVYALVALLVMTFASNIVNFVLSKLPA